MVILIKKYEKLLVSILLIVFLANNLYLAATDSQTIDEGPHISGGYSYWLTRDFRINPEHPPLVKLLAALPLLFYRPSLPVNHESWQKYDEWEFGRQFLYYNEKPADTIIFLARIPVILLAVFLGFFIYKWSKELFGVKAGLLALFLFALSPNFIAHSHLVTTDVPLTLFFLLSIYYFGKYLKNTSTKNLLVAALFVSLAMLTKYSAIILAPILLLLYLVSWLIKRRSGDFCFKKLAIAILLFLVTNVALTLVFYGFELKKPLDDPRVQRLYEERRDLIESGQEKNHPFYIRAIINLGDPETPAGAFLKKFGQNFYVPAYSYWRGFFSVVAHNYTGHASYLLGMNGEMGWWHYFIIAFLAKTPLSTLILLLSTFFYLIYKFTLKSDSPQNPSFWLFLKNTRIEYYLLIFPPLIYFAWSMTGHINLGVRHIFPIYPFIFIIISSLTNWKFYKLSFMRVFQAVVIFLMCFYIYSNAKIFPYYLSYFNEAVGGPENGAKILLDSNLDWGQDFKRLAKYVQEKRIDKYYACNFGSLVTQYYVKNEMAMPFTDEVNKNGVKKGYYIISVGALYDRKDIFSWLQEYEPIDKIGYSIYVYKFD